MFYGVKFVYVNLQTDGQAIWQKKKKLLCKITELEKSKNLCSRHNQVGQIIIPRRSRRDIVLASSVRPSVRPSTLFVCPEPYLSTYWSDLIHSWYK